MNNTNTDFEQVRVDRKKGISAIWIIPLVALVFGAYLGFKAYMERGVNIVIHFESAEGIVPGKTKVHYKGLTAGVVNKIELDKDLTSVSASIEMDKQAQEMLGEDALFWMVRPEVSLSGVSGLETLTSGNYIAFRPSTNKTVNPVKEYIALEDAPPLPNTVPGLHITLKADKKGSIQAGSKIYYRQIAVGEVTSVGLDRLYEGVQFKVHIKEEYADLVSYKSRFWNASGLSVSGGLSGFKVRTESIEALMVGGIAFDNMEDLVPQSEQVTSKVFQLFEDFETAQVGLPIKLILPFGAGIGNGTKIVFEGFGVGQINSFKLDLEKKQILADASVDPRAKPFLTTDTVFYLVAPKASLSGIANLDALIKGRYISLRPTTEGTSSTEFSVLPQAPAFDYSVPGLHLKLITEKAGSLSGGEPVLFRNRQVGSIQQVQLQDNKSTFVIDVHVQPEFQHLITNATRFWPTGGIKLKGSLQRFELETGPLISLLSGGVTFDTIESHQQKLEKVENGKSFVLYDDLDDASFSHMITIDFPSAEGIQEGITPVLYNGVTVGEVKSLAIGTNLKHFSAKVGLDPKFSWALKDKTQFWLVTPSITEGNFDAILTGSYITLIPGKGKVKTHFSAQVNAPVFDSSAPGLQFVIEADAAGSIRRGTGIFYQNLRIGEVQGVKLNKKRGGVDIFAHVPQDNQDLVKTNSRFYHVSGVSFKGDISGFKFSTESFSSILKGGVSLYTPKGDPTSKQAEDKAVFAIHEDLETAKNAGVNIQISFDQATGLRKHMPIKYQDQKVGEVTNILFKQDLSGVIVEAVLRGGAMKHARKDSRIWLVRPEVGLTNIKNIDTLITGTYLEISPGKGEPTYKFVGIDRKPITKVRQKGLNIILSSDRLGSLKAGDAISYRQIPIGAVVGVDLADDANGVLIYVNIYSEYQKLIKNDSVFWNSSGLSVDAGLFSGVKINTDSIESLLSGGIAMATPKARANQTPAEEGSRYPLNDEENEKWREWKPTIYLHQ